MKYFPVFLIIHLVAFAQPDNDEKGFKKDFQILKKALIETHPSLYRFNSQQLFKQTFDSIELKIDATTTHLEFFRMISRVESLIKEGHSYIRPSTYLLKSVQAAQLFPFNVSIDNEKLTITESSTRDYESLVGQEIYSVNGESIPCILKRLAQSTGLNSALSHAAMKHIFSYSNNFSMAYHFFINTGSQFEIEYRESQNESLNMKVVNGAVAKEVMGKGYPMYPKEPVPPFELEINEKDRIAILSISTFAYWVVDLKEKDYRNFFERSFKELQEKQIQRLIIDVRNNRGGEETIAADLLTYFIEADFEIYKYVKSKTLDFRYTNQLSNASDLKFSKKDFIETDSGFYLIENRILETFKKKEAYHFDGDVFMILNGGSRSATNILLALAQSHNAATLVGTESGGAFEDVDGRRPINFTLPFSKIEVGYPAWSMKIDSKNGDRTRGVLPDILVEQSKQDLLTNSDGQLEHVYQLIKSAK